MPRRGVITGVASKGIGEMSQHWTKSKSTSWNGELRKGAGTKSDDFCDNSFSDDSLWEDLWITGNNEKSVQAPKQRSASRTRAFR